MKVSQYAVITLTIGLMNQQFLCRDRLSIQYRGTDSPGTYWCMQVLCFVNKFGCSKISYHPASKSTGLCWDIKLSRVSLKWRQNPRLLKLITNGFRQTFESWTWSGKVKWVWTSEPPSGEGALPGLWFFDLDFIHVWNDVYNVPAMAFPSSLVKQSRGRHVNIVCGHAVKPRDCKPCASMFTSRLVSRQW
jgi:hypothetical protein